MTLSNLCQRTFVNYENLSMGLLISDDFLERSELSAEELQVEMACHLYQLQRLSFGYARELSGLNHLQFQQELGKRRIPRHYDVADFEEDLRTIERLHGSN